MSDTVGLDVDTHAVLDQALLGFRPVDDLPGSDGTIYLDEEGTPVARRENGSITLLVPDRWQRPASLELSSPVVVPLADHVPAEPLPAGTTLLLPSAGVRADDLRHHHWATAWSASAADVVAVPFSPADATRQVNALASAYSTGPLVEVPSSPQPPGTGRVVLLSGLSGSGKSTIAKALVERLADSRGVTLLDGDVVRTHLSKGLGFSREDRDVNVRRIGWVAAEVAKHGGLVVCAPIAPYDETRRWVRATVDAAAGPGAFLLVWVSTPIEVCEQRDVKGLYAKARAGELKGFTGIDDPYEPPDDADLVIDTSTVPLADAVDRIESALTRGDADRNREKLSP